jgi:hypothetical protein
MKGSSSDSEDIAVLQEVLVGLFFIEKNSVRAVFVHEQIAVIRFSYPSMVA